MFFLMDCLYIILLNTQFRVFSMLFNRAYLLRSFAHISYCSAIQLSCLRSFLNMSNKNSVIVNILSNLGII